MGDINFDFLARNLLVPGSQILDLLGPTSVEHCDLGGNSAPCVFHYKTAEWMYQKKKNIGTTKIITVITVLILEEFDFTVW